MGVFDSLWDRASALLDTNVDAILSDRVRYRHRGQWLGAAPQGEVDAVCAAFIVYANAPLNIGELDETLGSRVRVKIAKALVDEPIQTDRIQHPKLGDGWFRPAGSTPETEGRYWIFDVQKASAP